MDYRRRDLLPAIEDRPCGAGPPFAHRDRRLGEGGVVSHVAIFLPGGLGIKELTMAALLSAVVPMPIAILVSVVARLWFSLNELIWLLLSSRLAWNRKRTPNAGPTDPIAPRDEHPSRGDS